MVTNWYVQTTIGFPKTRVFTLPHYVVGFNSSAWILFSSLWPELFLNDNSTSTIVNIWIICSSGSGSFFHVILIEGILSFSNSTFSTPFIFWNQRRQTVASNDRKNSYGSIIVWKTHIYLYTTNRPRSQVHQFKMAFLDDNDNSPNSYWSDSFQIYF